MRGYLGQRHWNTDPARIANADMVANAKWAGRTVVRNGTAETGKVVRAWVDGSGDRTWLYIEPTDGGKEVLGDTEHWTIVVQRSE